jgi:hypothetical protein
LKKLTKEEWEGLFKKIQLTHWISQTTAGDNLIVEIQQMGPRTTLITGTHEKFLVLNSGTLPATKGFPKNRIIMDYYKSTQLREPLIGVLRPFADHAGTDLTNLVDELFSRYTVDDFAYHDDSYYYSAMKYFEETVVPHKIAVYDAGLQLARQEWFMDVCTQKDEFLRNLVRHDLSKFSANEAFGYAMHNFKQPHPITKEAFELAWHHHKMNNPHHPEYWLNPNRSGTLEILKMPPIYVLEMIADWIGAGKTYGSTLEKWIPGNIHLFTFHPDVLDLVQQLLVKLGIKTHKSGSGLYTTNE